MEVLLPQVASPNTTDTPVPQSESTTMQNGEMDIDMDIDFGPIDDDLSQAVSAGYLLCL